VKLASYGHKVQFVTALGNDPRAKAIQYDCESNGVLLDYVQYVDTTSAVLMRLFDEDHSLLTSINDMEIFSHLTTDVFPPFLSEINKAKLCVLDANLPAETLSYLAEAIDIPIYYEPISPTKAKRIGNYIGRCHTIKANRFEAAQLTGCSCDTIRGVYRAAEWLLEKGVQQVLISLGDEGVLYASNAEFGQIEGERIDVKDTSGAGDVLYASFIDALLCGNSLEAAAAIGNHAAALHCAKLHGHELQF